MLSSLLLVAGTAHAAAYGIDSTEKYAWSTMGGWVNFNPVHGGVTVSDTSLSGYAWSATDGWINLSPAGGGVSVDRYGALSGFAWDETTGWINFSGVTIDGNGLFHGSAVGTTPGGSTNTITFDCTHCSVVTAWRPGAVPPPPPSEPLPSIEGRNTNTLLQALGIVPSTPSVPVLGADRGVGEGNSPTTVAFSARSATTSLVSNPTGTVDESHHANGTWTFSLPSRTSYSIVVRASVAILIALLFGLLFFL